MLKLMYQTGNQRGFTTATEAGSLFRRRSTPLSNELTADLARP
ncbi:hypothetical protein [Endozoicomonas sp.]|nr:hypothetical protein [Endozoicomonas sp.]